jgi:signal transduction histidine kinase
MMRFYVAVFVGVLALTCAPEARVHKVVSGTDTVSEVLPRLSPGDTLLLSESGTYVITDTLRLPPVPLSIIADPSLRERPIWINKAHRNIQAYHNLRVEGIRFDGRHHTQVAIRSYALTPNTIHIENCEFQNFIQDAVTEGENCPVDTCIVRNTVFRGIGEIGIEFKTADMCHYLEIENCTFYENKVNAIRASQQDRSIKVRISNVTIYACREGIDLIGVPDADVRNSIITGCEIYAIRSDASARITYVGTYNNFRDYRTNPGGKGCLNADPYFYDPQLGDFSLLPSSPYLSAGPSGGPIGDLRWSGDASRRASRRSLVRIWGRNTGLMAVGILCLGLVYLFAQRRTKKQERKHLEVQIQQAERLESLGILAGGLAHDFNSMNAITVMRLEMVQRLLHEKEEKRHVDEALMAAQRAQELAQQLLVFSRGQARERALLFPAPIINKALGLIQSNVSGLSVHIDLDDACGPVLAQELELAQVVTNLCLNALDAMHDSGEMTVSLKRVNLASGEKPVDIRDTSQTDYCELIVRDTGSGMSPDIVKHVFEPFYSTKPAGKGTGLGLSIVYGIVKSYGGAITCDSELGKGTTFRVLLPESEEEF